MIKIDFLTYTSSPSLYGRGKKVDKFLYAHTLPFIIMHTCKNVTINILEIKKLYFKPCYQKVVRT